MTMGGVFISYRREDTAGFTARTNDRMWRRLGRERVFIDVDNIRPGSISSSCWRESRRLLRSSSCL